MFNFFDDQKNPLMFMMNLMNSENAETAEDAEAPKEAPAEAELMELMKQAFGMQMQMMQMMQTMCMLPMQLMLDLLNMMETGASEASAPEGQKSGFKLGNMEIPPWLLTKLMQIDMSPENLAKLQRLLDFVFEAMPRPKDE